MVYSDDGVRLAGQESIEQVGAFNRFLLGASGACPLCPNTSKASKRPIGSEREPRRGLAWFRVGIFAKRSHRNKAAKLWAKPSSPMRRLHVADIGDGVAAELRRARHAPAHHAKLTRAIFFNVHHGRERIGKNAGQGWDVAGVVEVDLEEAADSLLVLGHGVEIAHGVLSASSRARPSDGRLLHHDKTRRQQIFDKPRGGDLRHVITALVEALAPFEAKREGKTFGHLLRDRKSVV